MSLARTLPLALLASMLACGGVLADPPQGKGGGHGKGQGQSSMAAPNGFPAGDVSAIQGYFLSRPPGSACPPGLAKKNNGCMPPGQARQWAMGKPLPAGVVAYPLPGDLAGRLVPPAGYRYARVGSDVLMLAIGTNLVVTALTDLVR